jgi:hypothetical protein
MGDKDPRSQHRQLPRLLLYFDPHVLDGD